MTSSSYNKSTVPSAASLARRALLRKIHKQELRKLKMVLPKTLVQHRRGRRGFNGTHLTSGTVDDEMATIMGAVAYIDQLHAAVLARVRSGSLNPGKI